MSALTLSGVFQALTVVSRPYSAVISLAWPVLKCNTRLFCGICKKAVTKAAANKEKGHFQIFSF